MSGTCRWRNHGVLVSVQYTLKDKKTESKFNHISKESWNIMQQGVNILTNSLPTPVEHTIEFKSIKGGISIPGGGGSDGFLYGDFGIKFTHYFVSFVTPTTWYWDCSCSWIIVMINLEIGLEEREPSHGFQLQYHLCFHSMTHWVADIPTS